MACLSKSTTCFLEPLKTVKLPTLVPSLSLLFNYTALIRKATLERNTILPKAIPHGWQRLSHRLRRLLEMDV